MCLSLDLLRNFFDGGFLLCLCLFSDNSRSLFLSLLFFDGICRWYDDDAVLLQSCLLQGRIESVDVLNADIICFADGVQCLSLEHNVRIAYLSVDLHFLLGYGHRYRCV